MTNTRIDKMFGVFKRGEIAFVWTILFNPRVVDTNFSVS